MTEPEPDPPAPGDALPPPQPPGPAPAGYMPRQWIGRVEQPGRTDVALAQATAPEAEVLSTPPSGPFLDTPWVPPRTKRQAWIWLVYAVAGFLVGQVVAAVFAELAGLAEGQSAAQLESVATQAVPPEWYVVSTLVGLWVGFVGAPWLASRTQGTRHFLRDLGVRFRLVDLAGIGIGIGGQLIVSLMYQPFQHEIHDFNAPSQKLTGASHGGGFVVIAIATVLLAPAVEELFFRGLLLKALVRLFTPLGAVPGGARTVGVVLAVILDGLLFGVAHGEWVQLAGLATFGIILAAVSYRTGRLGMNMVAHATFNLVAIVYIAYYGSSVIR